MAKTLEQRPATLQRVPQMVDGLNDIIEDSKLELPGRGCLFMYKNPEMQNFREIGAMDKVAKKQQDHRILMEEVLETARESGRKVPDISHVAAAVSQQANWKVLRREQRGRRRACGWKLPES